MPYNTNNPVITTDQKPNFDKPPPSLEGEEEEEDFTFTTSRGYGSYILGHRMKLNLITIFSSIFVILVK